MRENAQERTAADKTEKSPVINVPSEGTSSEIRVQIIDTDNQSAVQGQNKSRLPEVSDPSNIASSPTTEPPKGSNSTLPTTIGSGGQQKTDTSQKADTQSKKKFASPEDPFEPWERELMEELLDDVRGHLGKRS